MRVALCVVLFMIVGTVQLVFCAWDDDAPDWAKERLAKADNVPADPQTDLSLKPTVYADILVYDTKKANCAGPDIRLAPALLQCVRNEPLWRCS